MAPTNTNNRGPCLKKNRKIISLYCEVLIKTCLASKSSFEIISFLRPSEIFFFFFFLNHFDVSARRVTSELHRSQVTAGRHCSQHAVRQTLGLLDGAAAARPVRLPRVSFVTVTATFEASCGQTDRREDRHTHTYAGSGVREWSVRYNYNWFNHIMPANTNQGLTLRPQAFSLQFGFSSTSKQLSVNEPEALGKHLPGWWFSENSALLFLQETRLFWLVLFVWHHLLCAVFVSVTSSPEATVARQQTEPKQR